MTHAARAITRDFRNQGRKGEGLMSPEAQDRFWGEHTQSREMRTALYTRVSSNDQNCEIQIRELRAYAQARSWEIATEFKDKAGAAPEPIGQHSGRLWRRQRQGNLMLCSAGSSTALGAHSSTVLQLFSS